jgi:hypothetical protein
MVDSVPAAVCQAVLRGRHVAASVSKILLVKQATVFRMGGDALIAQLR